MDAAPCRYLEEHTLTAEQMWSEYIRLHPEAAEAEYEAWQYGDDPDALARLTCSGIKTATASALALYELEGESLPEAGEFSVILWEDDQAACVIRTDLVYTVPFDQVSAEQAWKEGEGDRSLEYWRRVHRAFFAKEMDAAGLAFTEDMGVVCEEFSVVYPL